MIQTSQTSLILFSQAGFQTPPPPPALIKGPMKWKQFNHSNKINVFWKTSLPWFSICIYAGICVLLNDPLDQTLDTLFFPFTCNWMIQFRFRIWLCFFVLPSVFHLGCLPLVLLCVSRCSWFKPLQGFRLSHLGLILVHLPQWVPCC